MPRGVYGRARAVVGEDSYTLAGTAEYLERRARTVRGYLAAVATYQQAHAEGPIGGPAEVNARAAMDVARDQLADVGVSIDEATMPNASSWENEARAMRQLAKGNPTAPPRPGPPKRPAPPTSAPTPDPGGSIAPTPAPSARPWERVKQTWQSTSKTERTVATVAACAVGVLAIGATVVYVARR